MRSQGGRAGARPVGFPPGGLHMSTLLELLKRQGLRRLPAPVQLASGEMSDYFIDGKEALAHYDDLEVACAEIVGRVVRAGIEFDAAGGLTLGADALAVGIAAVARCQWFFVRKE